MRRVHPSTIIWPSSSHHGGLLRVGGMLHSQWYSYLSDMISVCCYPTKWYANHILVLTLHTVMYIKNKGSIAGPTFKIPFMGPFLQSLNPRFAGYLTQFGRGKLSCVSVFHKYLCRKIQAGFYIGWQWCLQICYSGFGPWFSSQSL